MSSDRRVSLRRILSRPFIVAGVVIVVAGGSIGAWAVTRSTASTNPSHRLFPAVRTTLRQTLSATGTIEPTATDTLSFAAPGQVTAVYATVGQRVTEGQNLAAMESASLQAQVAQAQATLAEDQSRLSQDEAAVASSAQIAADQATVNADESQVESAEAALSGATLTSPIDGIVATVGLTVGEQVSGGSGSADSGADGGSGGGADSGSGADGGSGGGGDSGGSGGSDSGSSDTSITVISAGDVVNASVGASVVDRIKVGDQVVITTEGANGPVSGTVASIGLTADTSSGVATFPVVIDVTGTPSGLYAGAAASVTIIYHQLANALAVPAAAVLPGPGGKPAVHVMVNGHQVTKTVTTGVTVNGLTQITSGLTAGERVVVNLVNISPGSPGGGSGVFVGPGGHVIQVNGGPPGGIGG